MHLSKLLIKMRERACVRHNDKFNEGYDQIRDTRRDDTHGRKTRKLNRSINSLGISRERDPFSFLPLKHTLYRLPKK